MIEAKPSETVPTAIRSAGVVAAIEGLIGMGIGILLLVHAIGGVNHEKFINGYGTAAWFLILGAGVCVGGSVLALGRRWGRAIVIVAQILLLPVAFAMLTDSGQPWLGAPIAIVAIAVLVAVFMPKSVAWHVGRAADDDEDD